MLRQPLFFFFFFIDEFEQNQNDLTDALPISEVGKPLGRFLGGGESWGELETSSPSILAAFELSAIGDEAIAVCFFLDVEVYSLVVEPKKWRQKQTV